MVRQGPSSVDVRSASPKVHLPARRQPWELAMVMFGLPGGVATALLTCGFVVFSASTDPIVWIAGVTTIVTVYLSAMVVLWVGTASEL